MCSTTCLELSFLIEGSVVVKLRVLPILETNVFSCSFRAAQSHCLCPNTLHVVFDLIELKERFLPSFGA